MEVKMQFNFLNQLFKSDVKDKVLNKIDHLIDDNFIYGKYSAPSRSKQSV